MFMNNNRGLVVELTISITRDLREDLVRDLIVIASSIAKKNYGIKVVGRITYSTGDRMFIEINGVKHYLNKGIPSIRDLIDLIVMAAIPHGYDGDSVTVYEGKNSYDSYVSTNI